MLRLYRGSEASELIFSATFQNQWAELFRRCPWATVHQDVAFVTAWYESYSAVYAPLVITDENGPDHRVEGILFLAISHQGEKLVQCGAHLAEYHVWLSEPGRSQSFIEAVFAHLSAEFPHERLEFLFLPPNTPQGWTGRWATRCLVREFERPLLSTAPGNDIRESLKKKANKSKLNRLQRLGIFEFSRVTDPEEFDRIYDEISPFCDTREIVLSGATEFRRDPLKAQFYRAMMRKQGLLHVTVSRLDGRVIAAHIGPINGAQVILGMIVHSPFYARHSIGKLHILLLALHLEGEGFQALDLTPGGDYKERFASHHDTAHILTVFFSARSAAIYKAGRFAINFGKRFVKSEQVTALLQQLAHKRRYLRPGRLPATALKRARSWAFYEREMRVYVLTPERVPNSVPNSALNRDSLEDLLRYAPSEAWQPRFSEFIARALERLGDGCHFYSRIEEGRLAHWGWMVEQQEETHLSEVGQSLRLPPGSATLFDYYTPPEFRGRGYYRESLRRMLSDAAALPATERIFIAVEADNRPSRAAIEHAGFEYWGSLWERRRFNRVRRWRQIPELGAGPDTVREADQLSDTGA